MSLRAAVLAFSALGCAAAAAAQTAPPRDQLPSSTQTGTAAIRGRVVAATGRPLRRAQIRLMAPELGRDERAIGTDDEGRYEFVGLPPGRYSLQVTRNGYLPIRYGQRRRLEQGRILELIDGQAAEGIDFTLQPTSAISGRITDEVGDPIAGVIVFAMRMDYWNGRRQLVPGSWTRSDDAGEYRVGGLVPATYVVLARSGDKWIVGDLDREDTMGYAPTYYPGIADAAAARRIQVGIGAEITAVDFSLTAARAVNVSGTAFDSLGRPLSFVLLVQETLGGGGGVVGAAATERLPRTARSRSAMWCRGITSFRQPVRRNRSRCRSPSIAPTSRTYR